MSHNADMHKAVATIAAVAAAAHSHAATNPNSSYAYRILNAPTSSDERAIKTLGIQPQAQRMSDALFAALQGILGGQAPKLNFTVTGDPLTNQGDLSASAGRININPLGTWALTDPSSKYHDAAVVSMPHEQAHLRQIAQVLADLAQKEGGAQAFADLVTPVAAKKAGVTFNAANVNDGSYAAYVKQAQARGNDWLTGGQFGHAPVAWP